MSLLFVEDKEEYGWTPAATKVKVPYDYEAEIQGFLVLENTLFLARVLVLTERSEP